ncbi:MAG: chemotaxis-specific protein-glutamate methyltransferase CheB [Bacteroidales bacterium]
MKKIKVLIVEDSLVSQKLLKGILDSDPVIEVVAIAQNGIEAIDCVNRFKPDVVSMDINMPVMNGIEATRKIMSTNPVPIVIVSSIYNSVEIEAAIKELEAGAVIVLPKPFGPGHPEFAKSSIRYRSTLKLMSGVKVEKRAVSLQSRLESKQTDNINAGKKESIICNKPNIVAIGASAGGPEALKTILMKLNKDFPLPILIVQHIDKSFSEGFANWLNFYSKIPVKIAENGEKIRYGNVYISPGGTNMSVNRGGVILLSNENENSLHKPSINLLFKSAGSVYGSGVIALLLSGMGNDGATELKNLKNMGACTFVQDEKTSLVYGMPGEAVKLDAACRILTPDDMVNEINNLFNKI